MGRSKVRSPSQFIVTARNEYYRNINPSLSGKVGQRYSVYILNHQHFYNQHVEFFRRYYISCWSAADSSCREKTVMGKDLNDYRASCIVTFDNQYAICH